MYIIIHALEIYFVLCFFIACIFILIGYMRNRNRIYPYNYDKNNSHIYEIYEMEEYLEIQVCSAEKSSFIITIDPSQYYIFRKAVYNLGYLYEKVDVKNSKYKVWGYCTSLKKVNK
ncbi:hypothetical protein [Clostridium tyrobutyricum]|uniref:hypothetical protein n=1 Tax=Clostridium tyrobutyricum TaxID=1519 RepID=UPI00073D79FE|nr:hypothetical protein [Clostridium tyrobutyricum]MBV4419274.1 hypothetical protein [Clostridium tyrobutyricum]